MPLGPSFTFLCSQSYSFDSLYHDVFPFFPLSFYCIVELTICSLNTFPSLLQNPRPSLYLSASHSQNLGHTSAALAGTVAPVGLMAMGHVGRQSSITGLLVSNFVLCGMPEHIVFFYWASRTSQSISRRQDLWCSLL